MDIVKYEETIKKGLMGSSFEQRRSLTIALLGFYFQLPDFEDVVSKFIKISIDKNQLVSDISKGNVENYRKALKKSDAELDEYSDGYEELDAIELFILGAFENAIGDLKSTGGLFQLFIGIIDTLDYYEQFSDEPEFWNSLLAKEVDFQNEILATLKSQDVFDPSVYQKRYNHIDFSKL